MALLTVAASENCDNDFQAYALGIRFLSEIVGRNICDGKIEPFEILSKENILQNYFTPPRKRRLLSLASQALIENSHIQILF